jgi:hypothetical protein
MSFVSGITAEEAAEIYLDKLISGLREMGFDDVEISQFYTDETLQCHGAGLWISGERIAVGIGEDEFEAADNLLDRAADLFFDETPEA